MEVEKICCGSGGGGGGMISGSQEDDDAQLPGFRFHPTDEELVGFYLRRKVEKRAIRIELIKQVDIYKYDPWDLPKEASSVGDKEWYFFCKRGRKYRNSIRPNRVTGSGFWKATGIDRPIYAAGGEGRECIGLKKSLVYYRGSAGKGTKTDWMMHEFRLPSNHDDKSTKHIDVKSIAQEACGHSVESSNETSRTESAYQIGRSSPPGGTIRPTQPTKPAALTPTTTTTTTTSISELRPDKPTRGSSPTTLPEQTRHTWVRRVWGLKPNPPRTRASLARK
ncbi:hypothetical protein NMG60_11001970 [Bertholletia excelsa]